MHARVYVCVFLALFCERHVHLCASNREYRLQATIQIQRAPASIDANGRNFPVSNGIHSKYCRNSAANRSPIGDAIAFDHIGICTSRGIFVSFFFRVFKCTSAVDAFA